MCSGLSESWRSGSLAGEPIVNAPAGTTTISGHMAHSLKIVFGASAHSSPADNGWAGRAATDPSVAPPHGEAGGRGGAIAADSTAGPGTAILPEGATTATWLFFRPSMRTSASPAWPLEGKRRRNSSNSATTSESLIVFHKTSSAGDAEAAGAAAK